MSHEKKGYDKESEENRWWKSSVFFGYGIKGVSSYKGWVVG